MILERLNEENAWVATGKINGHLIIVEHPDKVEAFHGWVEIAADKLNLEARK